MDTAQAKSYQEKERKSSQLCFIFIIYYYELVLSLSLCEISIACLESEVCVAMCPQVHFADNYTAGVLVASHCAGNLNVS